MNDDESIIEVKMNEMKTAGENVVMSSNGIGSCVVITLYDPFLKVGAMAHPMLPIYGGAFDENPLHYVDSAIDAMLDVMEGRGALRKRIEAKVVGGANMFKVYDKGSESVGASNIESAMKKLKYEDIRVAANDTGGNVGRVVFFDINSGIVEVKTRF
jgi:chemotaxis protein CheD